MNKAAEDLVRPMEGLVLEKTVNSSATMETTNTKAELKEKDMNAVGNDVSSNLRGHFQKADIVKPDVKSNFTTTAAENELAKKITDQDEDEDAAYNMIKAHFRSMSSGGKKGGAGKWSFLI